MIVTTNNRKYKVLLFGMIMTAIITGQSSITVPYGSSITLPSGAYTCTGSITGDGSFTYYSSADVCVTPTTTNLFAQSQLGSVLSAESSGDSFGRSVSVDSDGDHVAIGAPYNDGTGTNAGHVRVFRYSSGSWSQLGSDIDGEAAGDEFGYSVSLDSDGDRVAIGAPYNDGTGTDGGHVRVFEYSNGSWTQLGSDIDGEAAGDSSGWSVSIDSDGDRVAIGAPGNTGGTSSYPIAGSGHARVYQYIYGNWTQLGSDIDGYYYNDAFGFSISLDSDGDRVAVGAPYAYHYYGQNDGYVGIYDYSNSSWSQLGSYLYGDAAESFCGYSVSIDSDGDHVAIGASADDGNGTNTGQVQVFKYSGSLWTKLGSNIDGEAAGDEFGFSVSIDSDGDRVAIGAPYNDGTASGAGHARLYQYINGSWTQLGIDMNGEDSNDQLGFFISLDSDGSRLAIGAPIDGGGDVRIIDIGTVTMAGTSGFCMMSSPVAGTIYSDLLAELWTQGMTGGDVTSGTANVWTFDVSTQSWSALTDLTTASLTAGEGFLIYVFDDTDNDGTDDLPVSLSVSGTENSSSASVSSISDGNWALCGNPYATTIDWDLCTRTTLATSAYVWDNSASAYKSWNGSTGSLTDGLIAPYQGFWVQASGGTGSITVETADKASTIGTFYKSTNDSTGSMSFSISSGVFSDVTYVSFMTTGEEGIDNSDAYKLLPMSPSERVVCLTYAEGYGLDINNLPYTQESFIEIPFDIMYLTLDENANFVTEENEITMNWDLSNLPDTLTALILTDNTTGLMYNLMENDEVTVSTIAKGSFPSYGSGGVNIYPEVGESHFTLTIHYEELSMTDPVILPVEFAMHSAYPNPFNPITVLKYDLPEESKVTMNVYDIRGRFVSTLIEDIVPAGFHHIKWNPVNLASGIYLIQMRAGEKVFNQKITYIK